MNAFELSDLVRQTGYEIHLYLGSGHLEKVYENALAHRLRKRGLKAEQQRAIQVFDEDGTQLGFYVADLVIADFLLIEVKAARRLVSEHEAQLLAYLKSCRMQHGLLINFGSSRFEIRKYASAFAAHKPPQNRSAL
jgi:GxxExxY protein